MSATVANQALCSMARLGLRHAVANLRRHRGDRGQRARARRLSEPDRGHLRRADARCLFLDRHAADVPALVVRQAFRPRGNGSTARAAAASPTRSSSIPIPASATSWRRTPWPMQTLVMAHAAFGHNHFFKNNYLFQQWTDAEGILDYLEFAKSYHRQVRGATRPAAVEAHPRCRARADGPWRLPLSAAARSRPSAKS